MTMAVLLMVSACYGQLVNGMVRNGTVRNTGVVASGPTIQASDSFNRADGALNGSSLDNALGGSGSRTWTVTGSSLSSISNNTASEYGGSGMEVYVKSSGSDVADSYVKATVLTPDMGVFNRFDGSGHYYLAYVDGTSVIKLYAFTGTYNQIGSDGGTMTMGVTIELRCVGTSITLLTNGVTSVSGTSGAVVSGVPGIYFGGSAGQKLADSFIYTTP